MATRAKIIETARTYLGVRFHHQGRTRAGLDCAGLVIAVARDLALSDFDVTGYARTPDGVQMRGYLEQAALRVAKPLPGDILLMRFALWPQHVAILTDTGIIHTHAVVRRVVEHGLDAQWAARVLCAYAFPRVE